MEDSRFKKQQPLVAVQNFFPLLLMKRAADYHGPGHITDATGKRMRRKLLIEKQSTGKYLKTQGAQEARSSRMEPGVTLLQFPPGDLE